MKEIRKGNKAIRIMKTGVFYGQYSWDGTRAMVEVAPPISEIEMNRFIGRRVTVTISGY